MCPRNKVLDKFEKNLRNKILQQILANSTMNNLAEQFQNEIWRILLDHCNVETCCRNSLKTFNELFTDNKLQILSKNLVTNEMKEIV